MYRRQLNCCWCNHPYPIWCPASRFCSCSNEVVNPIDVSSFGFFRNTAVGTVGANAIIPLAIVQGGGAGISATGGGAIALAAGIYEVTYFANGTIPASGTLSIKLRLNGVDVAGSVISDTQTTGNVSSLTQTVVITVSQAGIIELANNSTDEVTFTVGSLFVRRID